MLRIWKQYKVEKGLKGELGKPVEFITPIGSMHKYGGV